jgi:hypothetical protein
VAYTAQVAPQYIETMFLGYRELSSGIFSKLFAMITGDLCKTLPFAQFQRQTQILSLEILNVFLHLKFSPSLNLNKIEHFSKVSTDKGETHKIRIT